MSLASEMWQLLSGGWRRLYGYGRNVPKTSTPPPPPAANASPLARFTTSLGTGNTVNFNASGSGDTDGTISAYSWAFGDGATGTGVTTSHTYTTAGTYTVVLTVTDDRGASGTATAAVTTGVTNTLPSPSFTVAPSGLSVFVDGTASTDPDGTITTYAWNFGDSGTATGTTANHTYTAAGTYTVRLTVTDNLGGVANTTRTVSVSSVVTADTYKLGDPLIENVNVGAGLTGIGYTAKSALTVHNGDWTITTAGQQIKDTRITGRLIIRAANVVAENCVIECRNGSIGNPLDINSNAYNFTGRFLTIGENIVPNLKPNGVGDKGGWFLDRCVIKNTVDGMRIQTGKVHLKSTLIKDICVLSPDPQQQSDNKTHADIIQIEGGDDIWIEWCDLLGYQAPTSIGTPSDGTHLVQRVASPNWLDTTSTGAGTYALTNSTSTIMLTPNVSTITNLRIENNLLGGGFYIVNGGATGVVNCTGVIQNNRLRKDAFLNTGGNKYPESGGTPAGIMLKSASPITVTANIWVDKANGDKPYSPNQVAARGNA
jgi:PKD repeat protein